MAGFGANCLFAALNTLHNGDQQPTCLHQNWTLQGHSIGDTLGESLNALGNGSVRWASLVLDERNGANGFLCLTGQESKTL